jgi:4-amino-4-deoxy-L-arabinose transferase-like glycosyltransferase
MSKKIFYILFFGVIVLSIVLRLWQLGGVPASPDWDEVALGYNAYSILETGRDEYGKFLPVVFRSFDDYKPGLYTYLIIPFIPIFDLTVFTVRLPAAIIGVVGVIATFFLSKELFRNNKYKDYISLTVAFIMAISPWDIQFSRVAFEAHAAAVFNILVALFFIKALKKPLFLIPSAVFAALGIYMYQSEKVFMPLFLLILLLVYFKDFVKIPKKYIISAVLLGLLVILPMGLYIVTNKESLLRVKGTSVFSDQTQVLKNSIEKLERDKENGDLLGLVLDNRRIVYGTTIVAGYLSHFNLNWLFISADLARHHAPFMGLLYLWELPFLLLGIYFLVFGDFDRKTKLFIFLWLLITPIPASITSGVPHAVRTMNFLPVWEIIITAGIFNSLVYIRKYKILSKVFYVALVVFGTFNFAYYLNQYFVQQNFYTAVDWQYGWEETAGYVKSIENNYDKIIVSDAQPLDRSYMFFAFYLKFPPKDYQTYGEKSSGGFAEAHYFGKYEFRPLDFEKDSKKQNVLLVGLSKEFPSTTDALKEIKYPNGKTAIKIVGR